MAVLKILPLDKSPKMWYNIDAWRGISAWRFFVSHSPRSLKHQSLQARDRQGGGGYLFRGQACCEMGVGRESGIVAKGVELQRCHMKPKAFAVTATIREKGKAIV